MTTTLIYQPKKYPCANPECKNHLIKIRSTDKYCSAACAYKMKKKKGPAKQIKRQPIAKVSKKRQARLKGYSEIDLFHDIWRVRPHVSELSGKPLPYGPENPKMWVRQFLHVINKGRAPKLRLLKRNVMLATPDEHDNQDNFPAFVERKQELLREFYSVKIRGQKTSETLANTGEI